MTAADWPFDADREDPLTALRIPVVASFNPGWKYVAAWIGVDTGPYSWGSAEHPTDAEARMIASFIEEYKHYFFNEGYQRKLLERPLDVDSGCNTTVFVKYGTDDWGYRRASWTYGPTFVPMGPKSRNRHGGPLSLAQVMDRCHDTYPTRWTDWKTDHPDVFPPS